MKYLILLLLFAGSNNQSQSSPQTLYSKDFKWTIVIPDGYSSVTQAEIDRLQKQGSDAIEETIGKVEINKSIKIFSFEKDKYNNFEAYSVAFDNSSGEYIQAVKELNRILYQAYKLKIPDATIEVSNTTVLISGLEFQANIMKLYLANGLTLNMLSYNRLFGKNSLAINISFIVEKEGIKIIKALKNSKFE
jgi:hypothetical protein